MSQSKYRLLPKDMKRWRSLLSKHCLKKTSPSEDAELDRLQEKRYRLLRRHPKMRVAKKAEAANLRRFKRLVRRLDTITGLNTYSEVFNNNN